MDDLDTMMYFGTRAIPALIAGFILGVERTMTKHPAGIKTIAFVSLGSCMFSSLAFYLHTLYPSTDPTRIVGQIITGVGFLGAGTIFHAKEKVNGLTSAAMIWTSCSFGVMAGAGLFWVPIFASGTLVVIMAVLKWVEKELDPRDPT